MARAARIQFFATHEKLKHDVIAALWVQGAPPPDYVDLLLCRDVFHCRPSELAQEDADDILRALACLSAEAYIRAAEENKTQLRPA